MASFYEMSGDSGYDTLYYSPTNEPSQTSAMPLHMFPLATTSETVRSKRQQVKIACEKCKKSCKKCDQARPCLRCVKYGWPDECVDSKRKEREKGVKRGPYKKKNGKSTVQSEGYPYKIGVYTWPMPSGSTPTTLTEYAAGDFYAQLPFSSGDHPENQDGPSQLDAVQSYTGGTDSGRG
ncbi:hypothetical protein K438DRAFT_1930154 [Mycena galopus ATCC 62051]|nr:hypothetical protein K438DRAFT_1930154 [Mycena galopus ATCC 62051]